VAVVLFAMLACAGKDDAGFPVWTGDTGAPPTTDTDDGGFASDPLTIGFTGTVITVAGNPFGFDDTVRTTPVSGSLTYDLGEADEEGTDPMRSTYDHQSGTAPFTISVGGHTITGSGNPVVSINLYGGTTFRWDDGADAGGTPGVNRICAVDGLDNPDISIGFSVTGDDVVLASDALPDPFPWVGVDLQQETFITFSVEDANGTLLLQLDAFTAQ
jgi:hypothetical protein